MPTAEATFKAALAIFEAQGGVYVVDHTGRDGAAKPFTPRSPLA